MDSLPASAVECEEGEIIEDDFEDISDNSIIVPLYTGKSVSSKEHLPAISLSSVTEVDENESKTENKVRRRRKGVRRKNSKSCTKRKNSSRKTVCSDSDSDDYLALDRKLQRQLKKAIRVDNGGEQHKNSLRSRLRAMASLNRMDSDNLEQKMEASKEKIEPKVSSDEADSELTQLRLEALRTAVLNKFMHRKKRKVKEIQDQDGLSDISVKTDNSETNKENAHTANKNVKAQINNTAKKICLTVDKPAENVENKIEINSNIVIENNPVPEDDEDVLRALLLASMSKKITSDAAVLPSKSNNVVKQKITAKTPGNDLKNVTVKRVIQLKNHLVKNNVRPKIQPVQIPKVKPLIISVNADSDSDDDMFSKTIKYTSNKEEELKKVNIEIESTVEKFLKEQRAKVEAALSPIPKTPALPVKTSVILEKSSVKLLPKVKQIEYQKLLQKLKNAEKRPRIRRSSQKFNSEGKPLGCTIKKVVRTKAPVKQLNGTTKTDQPPEVRPEARILHKALKEMQILRNGRLQIQEKYKTLMPLVKKINETSIERKKYDADVKRLLEELAEAKKNLLKSHQDFNSQVKHLVEEKERIEKSLGTSEVLGAPKTRFTSTPIKENAPVESFEASSIPTTTPNSSIPVPEQVNAKVAEHPEKPQEEELLDASINPGDPNDIDKIYNKQKSSFRKYISPLDGVKRVSADDPFSIVCPYDVDGSCRDPGCVFRHLFK